MSQPNQTESVKPLPARPRLRDGIEIVPIDHNRVLLRSHSGTVMLSGEFVASILPSLLPNLDGSRTVPELLAMVGEDLRPEFDAFLRSMAERRLLHSDDITRDATDERLAMGTHEQAYWSLNAPSAKTAADRLQAATIVVSNLGGVGVNVARALAASGVGKLILIDRANVRPSDAQFGYASEHVGEPRARALAADISSRSRTAVEAFVSTVNDMSNWDQVVSAATAVVLCSDAMALAGFEKTNDACIRTGTRWVSARIDRSRGIIGPFVVPEQTACFTCFELRNRANADHPTDHEALYRYWKERDDCAEDWPTVAPFGSIVGGHVALDLQRVLAGHCVSAVHGRVLYLDLHTMESRFHEVLKLPRCPACSRTRERPMARIWDIRLSESTVVSGR